MRGDIETAGRDPRWSEVVKRMARHRAERDALRRIFPARVPLRTRLKAFGKGVAIAVAIGGWAYILARTAAYVVSGV